jgi:hypothetical protein
MDGSSRVLPAHSCAGRADGGADGSAFAEVAPSDGRSNNAALICRRSWCGRRTARSGRNDGTARCRSRLHLRRRFTPLTLTGRSPAWEALSVPGHRAGRSANGHGQQGTTEPSGLPGGDLGDYGDRSAGVKLRRSGDREATPRPADGGPAGSIWPGLLRQPGGPGDRDSRAASGGSRCWVRGVPSTRAKVASSMAWSSAVRRPSCWRWCSAQVGT